MNDIRVLVIDTSEAVVDLLRMEMFPQKLKTVIERVDRQAGIEEALRWLVPDLVFSAWSLPDIDGLGALQLVRRLSPDVPFMLVSESRDDRRELEAFRQGATDCVAWSDGVRLPMAVHRAMKEAADRKDYRQAQQALRESEIRFHLFMEQMPGPVYMRDLDGRFTFINSATERALGRPAAEVIGRKLDQVFPSEVAAVYAENDLRALLVRQPVEAVEKVLTPAGPRTFLSVKFPVSGADGGPVMVGGVSLDITDRTRERLQLARLSRMHGVLSGITAAIVEARSRDQLLREACRIAVDAGGVRMAWIGLTEPGQSKVTPVAWHGFDDGYLAEVGRLLANDDEERFLTGWSVHVGAWDAGVAAEAARRSEVMVCDDIEHDPRVLFRQQALSRGYRSMVALPLKSKQQAVGVMMLFSGEVGAFDRTEVEWLQPVASSLSLALDDLDKTQRLAFLSSYDPLTELPNRSLFVDRLARMLDDGAQAFEGVSLALFDLRRLRDVNLRFGRGGGDLVLRTFAGRLKAACGDGGIAGRIAADQFAAAVPEADAATLVRFADDRWNGRLAGPMLIDGTEVRIQFKLGISSSRRGGDSAEVLLQNAETALRHAKAGGETCVVHGAQLDAVGQRRRRLEDRLRASIAGNAFVLHYQPKVDLATRTMVGVEALIRWCDGNDGLVEANEFVPVLEETGLILEVGQWALSEAAANLSWWKACRLEPPRVSLNISPSQLCQADFVGKVLAAVGGPVNAAAHIDVEIAESAWDRDFEQARDHLRQLRSLGVGIVVDDFGTGRSSLSLLAQLPVTVVKIDRSLVLDMDKQPAARAIIAAIAGMANAMGVVPLAEGLQSEAVAQQLQKLGCRQGQGFHFGMPQPASDLARLLQPAQER